MPHTERSECPMRRGLSRSEALLLLALGAIIAAVILGTLARDRRRSDVLRADDALAYLERLLRLETAQLLAIPLPAAGPGPLPAGLDEALAGRLADFLPDGVFVPQDPWGHAYILLAREVNGRRWRVLACGGPEGRLGDPRWERRVVPSP